MRKSIFLFCLLATTFFSFTIVDKKNEISIQGAWKFIADKKVSFGVDHDVIYTGNVNDDFRQLRLKVTDGPLKMYDMKVYFDNGEVQDVSIRFQIRQGGESRVIDLIGGLRHLSKIEFWYETKGFMKGRARIAVWGKK